MPKCLLCKDKFKPRIFLQKHCMEKEGCIKAEIALRTAKQWKEKKKVIKEKLLSHSDHLNLLQAIFNTFIRLRDKDLPCISCGTTKPVRYDAGHFYSRKGYSGVRFDEDNVHLQCSNYCNNHLSGNFAEYSIQLPLRIGQQRFNDLIEKRHCKLELSIPEIKEQIIIYKEKIKTLKKV